MVLQVGTDSDKEKDATFSDVKLPLPSDGSSLDGNSEDGSQEYVRTKRRRSRCAIFSMLLNLALAIAVVVLAVRLCKLNKTIDEMRKAEVELEPSDVVDNEDSINVNAMVDRENHDKIREMEDEYGGRGWWRRVRCKLIIIRFEDGDSSGYGWIW